MPKTKDGGFILDDSELEPPYPYLEDVEKMLSSLTLEERKQLAAQIKGDSDNDISPEEYREYIRSLKDDEPQPRKRPGIEENVWSRFDDDGWGIYNVQPTPTDNTDKNDK